MVAHKSVFSQVAQHVTPPSSSVLASRHVYTYVDVMYTGCVRPVSSVSTSPGSSSSVGLRDLSWESALRALPPPLLPALRAELLDDPGMLCEYSREDVLTTDEKLGGSVAPSGAASSGQRTTSSLDLTGTGVAAASTTTASSGLGSTKGTNPKTGLSPVGMHVDVVGGDPRTDHASLLCESQTSEGMAATCPPCRPGAVALQTANPDSPALSPDHCLSHPFVPEVPDELTIEDGPSVPDELPSAGETDMNATSDCETTLFPGIFRIAERSEELCDPFFLAFKSCPPVSAHPS